MWSMSQPKFWPKKLVTSVQMRKNVASTVSRVASPLSRLEFALKYVVVIAARSSVWRYSSFVTCARWSPTSRRYARVPWLRPGSSRIASVAKPNWSRCGTSRRSTDWTACLSL